MVAQLLRLRLTTLVNAFRRGPRHSVRLVMSVIAALLATYLLGLGLAELRDESAAIAQQGIVIGGTLVMLAFAAVPWFSPSQESLDPRSFALFGLEARPLAAGLALCGLVGIPGIGALILGALTVVSWADGPAWAAAGCAIIAVATAVLLARISAGARALLRGSRRIRGYLIGSVAMLAAAAALVIVIVLGLGSAGGDHALLRGTAEVLSWTPLGAALAVPGEIAQGQPVRAALTLLLALATLAAAWLGWERLTARLLRAPERAHGGEDGSLGLGWFDALPDTASGAVAARALTYWARDNRYATSLLIVPVVPIVAVLALSLVGVEWAQLALLPLPLVMLFLAWSPHNDLAHDSSALWLHIASGVGGVADRVGRIVPILMIGVPLALLGSVISVALYGHWSALPGMLGVSLGLLLSGVGLSSYFSARTPYPAVQPGDSPFQQPQVGGEHSTLAQGLSLAGTLVCAAPAIVLAVIGLGGVTWAGYAALGAGLLIGAATFIGGIRLGGRYYDRHQPELMGFASTH